MQSTRQPILNPTPKVGDAPVARRQLLIVAMPALNEEATVAEVVSRVPRDIGSNLDVVVVVVDDGSTDATAQLSREAGAVVLSHPQRRGVGAAFHTALRYAIDNGADMIATLDADGQFNPLDIPALITPVLEGKADFSTASRFKSAELIPEMPLVKKWGNYMMSRLISRLAGQRFYDVSCGMRCYNRRAMLSLNLMGTFTYTQEVFLNLAFKHLSIAEVPIKVRGVREVGQSRVASNVFSYAVKTSVIIFRCYRDYQPLRFFGSFAALMAVVGAGFGTFLLIHWFSTGYISPHKWAGFVAMAFMGTALLSLVLGVLGDMLVRHRVYLEEILYYQRTSAHWRPGDAERRRRGDDDSSRA